MEARIVTSGAFKLGGVFVFMALALLLPAWLRGGELGAEGAGELQASAQPEGVLLVRGEARGWVPPVRLVDKNVVDVVHWIEQTADVNVLVHESLSHRKVTLVLKRSVPWRRVVAALGGQLGVRVEDLTEDTAYLRPSGLPPLLEEIPVRAIRTNGRVSSNNIIQVEDE